MGNEAYGLGGHRGLTRLMCIFLGHLTVPLLRPSLNGYQQTVSRLFKVVPQKHFNEMDDSIEA